MMDEVEIEVPAVVGELVAEGDVVHQAMVGTLEEVDGIEGVEMVELARPVEVVGEQSAAPFLSGGEAQQGTIVDVGRGGDLCQDHLVAVVALDSGGATKLEAIEVVPVVGAEKHVDRCCVILETTNGEGILTETEHPVFVGMVGEVEEVGVVEERYRAILCNHTLTEEVAELVVEVATDDEVEVFAVETVGVAGGTVLVEVIVVEVGTRLKAYLGEYR